MQHACYSASVLVRGRPITEYPHNGAVYVEGRRGSEFQLQFRNMSTRAVLAVPSVDGLSVMDGKPAGDHSSGYVVRGYSTVTLPGWRLNNDEVAKFVFQDRRRSYAGQTGKGENTGVIGFLVFEEMVHYAPHSYPLVGQLHQQWNPHGIGIGTSSTGYGGWAASGDTGIASTSLRSAHKISSNSTEPVGTFSLGTGFGRADNHAVREVDFRKKSSTPDARLVLFYDTRQNLERMGIQIKKQSSRNQRPNAFPAMQVGCTPPPGWAG